MKKALAIILTVLVADQASKLFFKLNWTLGQEYEVFPWFILHFTENRGMAFGMELGGDFGKLALSLFRLVAVGMLGWFLYHQTKKGASNLTIISLALVMAGALGNIIDSVFYGVLFGESYGEVAKFMPTEGGYAPLLHGRVVDMLHFPLLKGVFPDWLPFWGGEPFLFFRPVFNIADAAITVGIALIILFERDLLRSFD